MRTKLLGLAVVLLMAGAAQADRAKQVRYIGVHPVAKSAGGGFCYIEGPHVHLYPADKLQYRDHRGHQHFVGDPVAYGYDGPKFAYKGHHPIHVHEVMHEDEPDVEFCYLDGPHYHYFAPPEATIGAEFKLVGDAYFYVAEPPKVYVEARPAMIGINAVYKPLVYVRPVITVEAPVGWIGARAEFAPPVVVAPTAGAAVVAPGVGVGVGVGVHIPVPTVKFQVGIGVPGVVVHEHHHHDHHKHKHKHKHKKH
jgi:hypothetical protein